MQRAARSPARSHRDPRRGHRRAGRRTLWLRHLRSCRRPSRLTMSGWRPRRFRPAGSSQASCAISSSTARSSARSFVQGAVTVPVATLQIPGTFVTALQSGDLLKAIGAAAASVTGAADAAATGAIVSDGTIVAPRALNAFEVGVVGACSISSLPPPAGCRQSSQPSTPPARTPSPRSTGRSWPIPRQPSYRTAWCRSAWWRRSMWVRRSYSRL